MFGFDNEISPGAVKGALTTEPDTVPGAIHGSFSSGPGVKAFSRLLDSTTSCHTGTVAPAVELSWESADEPFSGAHCAIVEGVRPDGEYLCAAGIPACWPTGDMLDDAATGAVEEEGCSAASENTSVVDVKDFVSAVAVGLWLSGSAVDWA